jgi:hypothetical protein
MILNWDRAEEKDWAREWSGNIWHCSRGFKLKRGYRIEGYEFPVVTKEARRELGWDGSGEPPVDLKDAKEQHKGIWEKMHAKVVRKRMTAIQRRLKKKTKTSAL